MGSTCRSSRVSVLSVRLVKISRNLVPSRQAGTATHVSFQTVAPRGGIRGSAISPVNKRGTIVRIVPSAWRRAKANRCTLFAPHTQV